MTISQPHHFLTNEVISARKWNDETRDQANGMSTRPCAMMAKTFPTEWAPADSSHNKTGTNDIANVLFDKVVYDLSFDGSRMCHASTFVISIPGFYVIDGAYAWSNTNTTASASPALGTRHVAIGVNTCGQWRSNRVLFPFEVSQLAWIIDPPISPAGFTPLVQPQKVSAMEWLNRGDHVEMFAGQDTGDWLLDSPVDNQDNPDSVIYTIWMSIEYQGRYAS